MKRLSLLLGALAALLLAATPLLAAAAPVPAKSFYVAGAHGVPLAVTEIGGDGPEILFLHGLGQGKESFIPQLEAQALRGYHLVAFDLRGHGMSGKPWQAADYTDPLVWAEDVRAVMQATGLKKPVLVAWSYGTLVAADYIRAFGTDALSGLVLVSSVGGLVAPPPPGPATALPPELLRARALMPVPALAAQAEAGGLIVPMLARSGAAPDWSDRAARLALLVPPYAQPFLRQHPGANTDLLARIAIPLLFMHGDFEASFSAATIATLVAAPCRSASAYATGHSPFAEAPARFNAELAAFVAAAQRSTDRNDTKIAAQRGDADRNAPCSAAKGGLR